MSRNAHSRTDSFSYADLQTERSAALVLFLLGTEDANRKATPVQSRFATAISFPWLSPAAQNRARLNSLFKNRSLRSLFHPVHLFCRGHERHAKMQEIRPYARTPRAAETPGAYLRDERLPENSVETPAPGPARSRRIAGELSAMQGKLFMRNEPAYPYLETDTCAFSSPRVRLRLPATSLRFASSFLRPGLKKPTHALAKRISPHGVRGMA